MRTTDLLLFSGQSLAGARKRTLLMLLAMSIGVASVVLLTALGEGARRYVADQFASLGTHLLIMMPGRSETTGGAPPLFGETPRDLTLDDALALLRARSITRVAPLVVGNAPVSYGNREREVTVIGATQAYFPMRHLSTASGRALPDIDPARAANVAVLGAGLRKALFGGHRAIGQWVRVDDRRFRVIGVIGKGGQSFGQNLDDMIVIPVAAAQELFDTTSLFRVLIEARSEHHVERAKAAARTLIQQRHDGEDDVTIISQDALLQTFDDILRTMTYAVGGIAAISLGVAGILIMNVMLVAVSQRVAEIGLMKALGTPARQVLRIFLVEAMLLAAAGAGIGVLVGSGGILAMQQLLPEFPVAAPLWAVPASVVVAVLTGLLFGTLPARRAALLDPVQALSGR
ncbi:MAG: ABC transporter permease [Gammaproteobacteria bacterium]|nr:ABC transporter permease [Gammaproteobacteria bacterium]